MFYSQSLKDEKVFRVIFRKGNRTGCPYLTAFYFKNRRPYNRLGLSVGKKVGGAVSRNRAKRIIRAAYRRNELILPIGYDIVIVPRPEISDKKSTDLDGFFKKLSKDMKNRENASECNH